MWARAIFSAMSCIGWRFVGHYYCYNYFKCATFFFYIKIYFKTCFCEVSDSKCRVALTRKVDLLKKMAFSFFVRKVGLWDCMISYCQSFVKWWGWQDISTNCLSPWPLYDLLLSFFLKFSILSCKIYIWFTCV